MFIIQIGYELVIVKLDDALLFSLLKHIYRPLDIFFENVYLEITG
jgi:hypothetical protein